MRSYTARLVRRNYSVSSFLYILFFVIAALFAFLPVGLSEVTAEERQSQPVRIMQVSPSPDKQKIAFSVICDGEMVRIYWMSLYGGSAVFVNEEYAMDSISWSPDSRSFVYSAPVAARDFQKVSVKSFDTINGGLVTVVDTYANFLPTYSPQNRNLLTMMRQITRRGRFFLFLLDSANKSFVQLGSEPLAEETAWCWDSEGRSIYFCVERNDGWTISNTKLSIYDVSNPEN